MNDTTLLSEALALALKLSPKERIQLIERVASSVEREMGEAQAFSEAEIQALMKSSPKTGAEIAALLEQIRPIAFVDPEITDPVEWVNMQRRKETERLKPYWEGRE